MNIVNIIKDKIRNILPKGRFFRGIVLLSGSSLIAQLISILAAPIVTRLYSPQDYGVAAIISSIIIIFSIISTARYELAISLPEKDDEACDVFFLCMSLILFAIIIGVLIILIISIFSIDLHIDNQIEKYLWILPIGIFGVSIYQVLSYWVIRNRDYSKISKTKISQSIFGTSATLGIGVLDKSPLGLIIGSIVSQTIGIVSLSKNLLGFLKESEYKLSISRLFGVAKKYKHFPFFLCGAALLNSTSITLPSILLVVFYGPVVAGFFALAQRIISLPMTLIGQSVSQVFLGEASKLLNKPVELLYLFKKVTKQMSMFSILILLFGLLSPTLFNYIFGERWQIAGVYAGWLSLYCAFQLIISPISNITILLERQDLQLFVDFVRSIVIFISLYIPYILGLSGANAVIWYSVGMCFMYLGYYFIYRHLIYKFSNTQIDIPGATI